MEIREPPSANSTLVDQFPSERVLKTRCVFDDPTRPACHCAHFYYSRECHLGERCHFAHVAFLNPNAMPWERAPAPSALGRGKLVESESVNYESFLKTLEGSGSRRAATSPNSSASSSLNHPNVLQMLAREDERDMMQKTVLFPPTNFMETNSPVTSTPTGRYEAAPQWIETAPPFWTPIQIHGSDHQEEVKDSKTFLSGGTRFRHNPYQAASPSNSMK